MTVNVCTLIRLRVTHERFIQAARWFDRARHLHVHTYQFNVEKITDYLRRAALYTMVIDVRTPGDFSIPINFS